MGCTDRVLSCHTPLLTGTLGDPGKLTRGEMGTKAQRLGNRFPRFSPPSFPGPEPGLSLLPDPLNRHVNNDPQGERLSSSRCQEGHLQRTLKAQEGWVSLSKDRLGSSHWDFAQSRLPTSVSKYLTRTQQEQVSRRVAAKPGEPEGWRGQPGWRPGETSEGGAGEHLGLLHILPFSRSGEISSHLDTNRTHKGLLIPSRPHPLAWHQLCAHSLQLAACSRRPGHGCPCIWGSRQRGGPGLQQQHQPTAGKPTLGLSQDWHHAHPPSSLCVSRDEL